MIKIIGLEKKYGEHTVLKDIHMNITKGTIYGIAGKSGVGKSTLLRCINGLETYDKGQIIVDEKDLNTLTPKEMKVLKSNMGMVFQQFVLLNRATVYDNIALPMRSWKKSSTEIDKKIKELVELVGIADKLYEKPPRLSGGQKQRVAIARALSLNPSVLLCDEATSALDPNTAKSIIHLLNEINDELKITIIMVTHQMSVVKSACKEMAIMEDGRVAVTGTVKEIFMAQPDALSRLIGKEEIVTPGNGITIKIILSDEISYQPIITKLAKETGIDFLVTGGQMEQYRDQMMGTLYINVRPEDMKDITAYLNAKKVTWKEEGKNV